MDRGLATIIFNDDITGFGVTHRLASTIRHNRAGEHHGFNPLELFIHGPVYVGVLHSMVNNDTYFLFTLDL